MAVLREIFELWPPCFPDLSACDFYLWGNLKQKVHSNGLHNLESLKKEVWNVICDITEGGCSECLIICCVGSRHVLMWMDTTLSTLFAIQVRQNLVYCNQLRSSACTQMSIEPSPWIHRFWLANDVWQVPKCLRIGLYFLHIYMCVCVCVSVRAHAILFRKFLVLISVLLFVYIWHL
jgi:hypothetical protein